MIRGASLPPLSSSPGVDGCAATADVDEGGRGEAEDWGLEDGDDTCEAGRGIGVPVTPVGPDRGAGVCPGVCAGVGVGVCLDEFLLTERSSLREPR